MSKTPREGTRYAYYLAALKESARTSTNIRQQVAANSVNSTRLVVARCSTALGMKFSVLTGQKREDGTVTIVIVPVEKIPSAVVPA